MSHKVKNIILLNEQTLAAAEVDTQALVDRLLLNTYDSEKLNLTCKYTTGAGETLNTCGIKVWQYIGSIAESGFPYSSDIEAAIKADTDNWIQLGDFSITGGDATFVPTIFEIAGAAAATTYDAQFTFDIVANKIRISALETGVAANFGTLTVNAFIK